MNKNDSILISVNIPGCISSSENSQDQILPLNSSERFAYKSEDRLWSIVFCLTFILFLIVQVGGVCKGNAVAEKSCLKICWIPKNILKHFFF